jgi:hypothetical protein
VTGALVFEAATDLRIPFVTGDYRQVESAEGFGMDVIKVR